MSDTRMTNRSADLQAATEAAGYALRHAAELARDLSAGKPGTGPDDVARAYGCLAIVYGSLGRIVEGLLMMSEVKHLLGTAEPKGDR